MTEVEIKKLSDEFTTGINAIREKQDLLEKANLHRETKEKELDETILKVQKGLDQIEVAVKDLAVRRSGAGQDETPEHKAFMSWLRTGTKSAELKPDMEQKAAYRVSSDTAGGYITAPPTIADGIQTTLVESSPVRQIASVQSIGTESLEIMTQTAAFAANWAGETANSTDANAMTFGKERIPVHEIRAYLDVTNQLLEDSAVDLESFIGQEFGIRFGTKEANAFISANYVYAPQGILTDGNVANTAGGDANNVTADGLFTLYFAPKSGYVRNAVWLMARATMAYCAKLKNNDNDYLLKRLGESPAWSILGAPVLEAYDMPAMANAAYPVLFGDFKAGYKIVDRVGLSIMRDPYSAALQSAVRFHARKRVGGKVVQPEAIYKMKMTAS